MAIYKYYPNTVFVNVFPSQEFGALTLLQWTELEDFFSEKGNTMLPSILPTIRKQNKKYESFQSGQTLYA